MQQVSSFQPTKTGRLYLVPTPIGNLDDMTWRAVETLKKVDLIAAEDTRHTALLLRHFDIQTPEISFHEHNTEARLPELLSKLESGTTIAQCSDAGMPSISDPGKELVKAAVQKGIPVVPLPGPNAGLTALIASGINPQPFTFYGFLDRKPQQQVRQLMPLVNRTETLIFYEAPHRLKRTLNSMVKAFGSDRQAVLAREVTKRYEQFLRGTLAELLDWSKNNEVRGEFVVIVSGNPNPEDEETNQKQLSPIEQVKQAVAAGEKPNTAIKHVARRSGISRQTLYREYHQL